jgi:Family of unknown function (DUF6328)
MELQSVVVDVGDGRNETLNERMDRNWNEMLQEVRVAQTGTQILGGFLVTIAFLPQFAELSAFDRGIYLVLVVVTTVTTALALAPVHLHRSLFRRRVKSVVVQLSHLLLRSALLGLAIAMTGTVLLVFNVATGEPSMAIAAAIGVLLVIVVISALPRLAQTETVRRHVERAVGAMASAENDAAPHPPAPTTGSVVDCRPRLDNARS